jgi:Ca2+/Na+ antiporter
MELYESISLVLVYVMYVGVIAKRMHDVHAEQAATEASVEAIATEASEEVAPIGKVSQEASRGTLRHAHQRSVSVGKSGGGGGGGGVGGGVSPAASDEVLRQEAGAVYGEFESGAGMEAELGESGEGGTGGGSGEAATLDPLVGLVRLIRWVYSRTIPFPLVPLTVMEESVALLSGQSSPTEVASPSTPAWRVWSGVAVSLAYVALLSNMALKVAEDAAIALGLSRVVASATLLAAGAQVPDTLGSIAMSKAGLFNGAMSNAVGSQVWSTLSLSLFLSFASAPCNFTPFAICNNHR